MSGAREWTSDLRADFPYFEPAAEERPVVYLDSAASTPSPRAVLEAEARCRAYVVGNVHRGSSAAAEEASLAYESARRAVARFLGADSRCVVFVRGATEGLNAVARGLRLNRDDVVLATRAEHHANLVPWMREARVELLAGDPVAPVDPDVLRDALRTRRPRVLAIQHASNVCGTVQPVAELCRLAREHDCLSVVDASQSAPHLPLDVAAIGCDFLTFSGHKLLGPKGIGVLWGRPERLERLEPLAVGGGAIEAVRADRYVLRPSPYRHEAGTPNVAGAVGLAAAIAYLHRIGREAIEAHALRIARDLIDTLGAVPGVRVIAARSEPRLPIASIALPHATPTPEQVAVTLSDSYRIMVRPGAQCAHPMFEALGLTQGALRASAYIYNTEDDVRAFADALTQILARLGR